MQADHQRRRLVPDGGQVLGQPLHLRQRHDTVVVAVAQDTVLAARVDPVDVVEHHVVHLPEIERIVVRAQRFAIGKLSRGVTLHVGIVVVVAHGVEHGDGVAALREQLPVMRKPEIPVVPVAVPGHVSRHQAEDRHGTGVGESLRLGEEAVPEITQVVLLVGQVQVGAQQHDVIFGIGAHQFEVVRLARLRSGRQPGPEAHHVVVQRGGQVTRRNGDEDVAQRLERRHPVVAVGIGDDRLQTVRHTDSRHAFAAAVDDTLEVHPLLVGNLLIGGKVDLHRGDVLFLRTADHVDLVAFPGDPAGITTRPS